MTFSESLDRYFGVTERGSNFKTEIWGGILIFLSMSYIIVVNPSMMAVAGMDKDACYAATIIMSIIGTLVMALYAKYPVAQAPTMGVNAFFVYNVVLVMGFSWQQALTAVFLAGLIFFFISLSGVRKRVIDKIPSGLRYGITAGIGCFIVFIGLQNAGLITGAATLVKLGDLSSPSVLLGLFCIIITLFLYSRKVTGAVIIGMVVSAIVGICIGVIDIPETVFSLPTTPDFGAFLDGFSSDILDFQFLMIVVAFIFMQFFDSTGTLMATGGRAGIIDENGNVVCDRALIADATASLLSAPLGSTPTGAYAESTVGIEAGARTGLATLVVALMFVLALFVGPLFGMITYSCTVGAMFIVGAAMIVSLKDVEWDDWPQAVSVLSTMLFMILTYSIADGIAFGTLFYCVCMIGAKKAREVSPIIYGLAVICLMYFIAAAITL